MLANNDFSIVWTMLQQLKTMLEDHITQNINKVNSAGYI